AFARPHALAGAAAVPEAPRVVEVAGVPDAMPDRAVVAADLVLARGVLVAVVARTHVRAAHQDLADLAGRQRLDVRQRLDRAVVEAHDAQLDAREGAAHAEAGALLRARPGLLERLARAHLGGGQRLGGAVVREHLAALAHHRQQRALHPREDRRAAADHALEGRRRDALAHGVARHV